MNEGAWDRNWVRAAREVVCDEAQCAIGGRVIDVFFH